MTTEQTPEQATSYLTGQNYIIVIGAGAEKALTAGDYQFCIKGEGVNPVMHTVMSPEEYKVIYNVITRMLPNQPASEEANG
jgi:hypothetical protein